MKPKEIQFLIEVAQSAAKMSHGIRLKVGGVITDSQGNMVAHAYNGTIRGAPNELEYKEYQEGPYTHTDTSGFRYKLVTKESTVHCEANLIAHAARRGISVDGGTAILTHSPCAKCCALLIQSGIKEVIFAEKFRTYYEVKNEFGQYIKLTQH